MRKWDPDYEVEARPPHSAAVEEAVEAVEEMIAHSLGDEFTADDKRKPQNCRNVRKALIPQRPQITGCGSPPGSFYWICFLMQRTGLLFTCMSPLHVYCMWASPIRRVFGVNTPGKSPDKTNKVRLFLRKQTALIQLNQNISQVFLETVEFPETKAGFSPRSSPTERTHTFSITSTLIQPLTSVVWFHCFHHFRGVNTIVVTTERKNKTVSRVLRYINNWASSSYGNTSII